jgi:hypothetical protein
VGGILTIYNHYLLTSINTKGTLTVDEVDREAKIKYCEGQMLRFALQAMLGMTKVLSGAAVRKDIQRMDGTPLTNEEKIDQVLISVQTHIQWVEGCMDTRDELIRGKEVHVGSR